MCPKVTNLPNLRCRCNRIDWKFKQLILIDLFDYKEDIVKIKRKNRKKLTFYH